MKKECKNIDLSTLHFHQDLRNECCNIKALLDEERCARIGSIYFFSDGKEDGVWGSSLGEGIN